MHAKRNGGKGALIISSAARIIEDPKTPEAEAQAQQHKNIDLMYVEFILCHANANKNNDRFTSEDLRNNFDTAISKPINWEHKNKNIGVIYDSKFVSINEMREEDIAYYETIDPLENDFIVCRAVIWESKHPSEASTMRERASNGSLYFSMENQFSRAQCSTCNEVFTNKYEYCDHIIQRHHTKSTDRIFIDSNFVGAGVVFNPADDGAKTIALANEERSSLFLEIINSISMADISIESDILPYIIKEGNTMIDKKEEIPKEFVSALDIPSEYFADNVNRVFPLDTVVNVENSIALAFNNELDFYSKEEKLLVLEKIANAAKSYDLKIDYIHKGGNNSMDIMDNPEVQKAIAEEVEKRVADMKADEDVEKLKAEAEKVKKELEDTKKKAKDAEDAKKKYEEEMKKKEEEDKKKEKAKARIEEMKEKGFAFDKNADFVFDLAKEMNEDQYGTFVSFVQEAYDMGKASKEEDPVKESKEEAIANVVDKDKEADKFPMISKFLEKMN